ncbi:haloacid dehalogenase superfamily, subfamily IA, variant 3 with third motif having DD or ED [Streptomyces sp. LaPpAH-199]|uniref:HAD family hydrolase n=1 Tax=Streptomyces TaxID=1883 RepID=UPI0008891695|nr:HAD family phosphatase [Streptomyces sp. LaPpAH-199]MYW79255.1 HAD-IA family hydrolase [Streptomyces sp. SID8369]SDE30700.1 haloacid dehalogenase superfamily, subfamily IA, variant 3 with third motif having DD or ED [Streptomyces sp. LaPpAH-199]
MESPVELVIFDCDGVLVDTERIALRVQLRIGAELGWPLTEDEVVELFMGRSLVSMAEVVRPRLGDRAAGLWCDRFAEYHREAVDAGLAPVDGLTEALAGLDRTGLATCIASGGTHEKMAHTLGRTGLYERFAGRIHSATEVERGKPAPDLFLHAAAAMGFDPAVCVVVEDSRPGVLAARAAGMRCLGYAGGVTPGDWLEGPGTTVFDDMRELPGLLAGRFAVSGPAAGGGPCPVGAVVGGVA